MGATVLTDHRVAEFAPAGQMTEAQYTVERQRIRATYGDTATEHTGAFDQDLARLIFRSKWSDSKLAKHEGKTERWVRYRTTFGAFLDFGTTVPIPKSCTERRFREFWDRTDPNETNVRIRFREVARLMEEKLSLSKPPTNKPKVAKVILEDFADGKWHRLTTIVAGVQAKEPQATEGDVKAVLFSMCKTGARHTAAERRRGGGNSWSYRIVRGVGRKVDVDVLVHELGPIVQALKVEGRKHIAEASPAAIASLAKQLEVILERLTHEDARLFTRPAKKEKSDGTIV